VCRPPDIMIAEEIERSSAPSPINVGQFSTFTWNAAFEGIIAALRSSSYWW